MARETGLGTPASPGLAAGVLARLAPAGAATRVAGTPAEEADALARAIARAIADLTELAERAEPDAAEMLSFQIAMLEDEALSEGAFAAIAEGNAAERAWAAALDQEIDGYRSAEDAYFRARASDLEDMRGRVLRALTNAEELEIPAGAVVLGTDLTPSQFLAADWRAGGAILLTEGSAQAHVAMLARARSVPMVIGLGRVPDGAREALVDGGSGQVVFDPDASDRQRFHLAQAAASAEAAAIDQFRRKAGRTGDGTAIKVLINLGDPAELDDLDPAICDGVGLVRSEFLFYGRDGLPDEETQYQAYHRILTWAAPRPVTIRTLDAGGDKPVPGLTIDSETNPFLGTRGLRLSLAQPEVFGAQLRALARAAVVGNLRVMLPMVTLPSELDAAAGLLDDAVAGLAAAGIPHARPPLGIMVEIPAAALTAADFAADFYSIGSNDLTQYALAAARDIGAVARLGDAGHPAVLQLIRATVAAAAARGVDVSLCGDAGGEPRLIADLLRAGLRSLSVAPVAVGRTKAAIAMVHLP